MAERNPRSVDDFVDLDFGETPTPDATRPATPASPLPLDPADDPFAALATELTTSLEEDEGRRRRLAADEQRRLAAERAGGIEAEAIDADALETSLRADLLAADTATESGPRFRDVRAERRAPRSTRPGVLRRAVGLVGRLLSTGSDGSNLPRVAAGYASRTVAGALAVLLIVAWTAGPAGSAFDATYAPEAALARHSGGLVAEPLPTGGGANGMVLCDAVTGLALQERGRELFDLFDAAVASGDSSGLVAAFTSPDAAAEWVAEATRLHEAGAHREYYSYDPRESGAICDSPTGSDGLTLYFGGFRLYDLAKDDAILAQRTISGVSLSFIRQEGVWLLASAVLEAP